MFRAGLHTTPNTAKACTCVKYKRLPSLWKYAGPDILVLLILVAAESEYAKLQ